MEMESEVRVPAPEAVKDESSIKEVINKVKSQGLFDQFRKDCIADVDTKPAYHNLLQRVESYVEHFLQGQKWSLSANKNQLRETLRRQLHDSGMMQNGVERIIDQVVNPKILLGIKPKIDEAVCAHLGIDLKARQEEQQRRKQEQQKLLIQQIQQQQQQHLESLQNKNVKNDEAFKSSGAALPMGGNPWMPGMANFPSPSVPGVRPPLPGNPQAMGGNFPGMMAPFSLMGGWVPGFNPGMPPMMPGQPMIPAFPASTAATGVSPVAGMGPRPPFNSSSSVTPATCGSMVMTSPQTSVTTSTPVIPDLTRPPPGLPGTPLASSSATNIGNMIGPSPGISPLVPPGTARVAPAPPGSIPPPPGTVPLPPDNSALGSNLKSNNIPGTPTIPALISHTLAKVSQDELTPEKIAVFKTAAAFITKTVNNAQGSGADLNSIFSPRVLAEAMMEESGKPMTKQEIRAERRKERIKEMERQKVEKEEKEMLWNQGNEDKENPLPPNNLMDVFQAAEDVSDDEEALDLLMDMEEPEDKHKQGIVLSDDSDKEGEKPPTSQPGKRYNFAWDVDLNSDEMSDVTISSIHTSDMSSFEEEEEEVSAEESTKQELPKEAVPIEKSEGLPETGEELPNALETQDVNKESEEPVTPAVEAEQNEEQTNHVEEGEPAFAVEVTATGTSSDVVLEAVASEPVQSIVVSTKPEQSTPAKPRKLKALSYHYSDSDDEETREERKARIAKEKEERYLKRQQRRAELDAKKKERDEEKARLKKEKQLQMEKMPDILEENKALSAEDTSQTDTQNATSTSIEADSPSKATPKKRKNKAEMKEQLLQQKVMEKKAALRRKRTRNRRYASDEFTSIFSDTKKLNDSYSGDGVNQDEIVTFEGDGGLEIVEMTVDQECVVETVGEEIETSNFHPFGNHSSEAGQVDKESSDLVLQCPSPYSDISDRSMSERSEPENVSDPGVDEVSSDEELGDLEEVKIVDELEDSNKGPMSPSQSASESDVALVSEALTPDTSRMSSTRSKSILSQDEVESVSSQSMEKRKTSDTGFPPDEEDLESQNSRMESRSKSPVKSLSDIIEDDVKVSKVENEGLADTAASPTKDIMADLDLEPVSDEDSSLDGCLDQPEMADSNDMEKDTEEGEERDSDKEMKQSYVEEPRKSFEVVKQGKVDDENASDEGEIKSDSEEEKKEDDPVELEERRRRAVNRKPIHQVDFGEAEKRAREARVQYSGEPDWRGRNLNMNPTTTNYRGGFNTWTGPGNSSMPSYGGASKSAARFAGHDPSSPIRAKSPTGVFDAESEASSHSRSSVRVRDDVPPPYPIEGVNTSRKHRSPASISDNAVDYKPLSPPSPVSSSSSRHSRARSRSRSRSLSSSSRSSSYSSASLESSSRKKKRSKKSKKRKRRKEKQRSKEIPSPHSPRQLSIERRVSPRKSPDFSGPSASNRDIHLSSGNESISSDELPYFPDEEPEVPAKAAKQKTKRSAGSSSSSKSSEFSHNKRKRKESTGSISSSELIYSPTRKQAISENDHSDSSSSSSDKVKKLKRRRSSSLKSSQSSYDLPPVSPVRESGGMVAFSPHRPSSPITYPPLPDDMSGFQPPLPQENVDLPPLPPMPPKEPPPSPPPAPQEISKRKNLSVSEEEEGEYTSSPEHSHPTDSQIQVERNVYKDGAAGHLHRSQDETRDDNAKSHLFKKDNSEIDIFKKDSHNSDSPLQIHPSEISSLSSSSGDILKNSSAVGPITQTHLLKSEERSGGQIEPMCTVDSQARTFDAELVRSVDLKQSDSQNQNLSILNESENVLQSSTTGQKIEAISTEECQNPESPPPSSPPQNDSISCMSAVPKEIPSSPTTDAPTSDIYSQVKSIPSEERSSDELCPSEEKPADERCPSEEKPADELCPSEEKPADELCPSEEKPADELCPSAEKPADKLCNETETNPSVDNNNKTNPLTSSSQDVSSKTFPSAQDATEHSPAEPVPSIGVTSSSSPQKSEGLESNNESRKRGREDDENSSDITQESDHKRIKESDD